MGIGYCNRGGRYGGHDTNCPTVVGEPGEQQLRSRIEQLTARIAELEEENTALVKTIQRDTLTSLRRLAEKDEVIAEAGEMLAMRDRQLAALEAEVLRLRGALETFIAEHEECEDGDGWTAQMCSMEALHVADEVMSTPFTPPHSPPWSRRPAR